MFAPDRPAAWLFTLAVAVTLAAPTLATTPYDLGFAGTFELAFGAGPDLTDEPTFQGAGGGPPLGPAHVAGVSHTQAGPDGCATIVDDAVTLTVAATGDELWLVNEGTDCVDVVSHPGRILIHGSGATTLVGGTGAFDGVKGAGTWSVEAEVTGVGPGHVEGHFSVLRFVGTLTS